MVHELGVTLSPQDAEEAIKFIGGGKTDIVDFESFASWYVCDGCLCNNITTKLCLGNIWTRNWTAFLVLFQFFGGHLVLRSKQELI